ncbi:amidohydrolase [Mycobacterium nebraskense]|uniref:Amidohydrolase n=1 Tax=Mycobacterium nebraskense TaxID=244292 RepID=A0A0F5N3P3_9MYCO|nr:amidohydrolase [Mycobacterium nebraskense]KLO33309.1 amidohydrolase [Mycobacterium nebraskense]MCV7116715.1 NUDIX domain-containing protein [Mycobacterium nebraskense]ORW35706.1 amidohydrolase [Mycobacterium nebraskense]
MTTESDSSAVPCSPCVARLQSPEERLHSLRAHLFDETDPLVTLTHLLHLCRDEHQVLWAQAANPDIRAKVTSIVAPVRAIAESSSSRENLAAPIRKALADALAPDDGVAPVTIAHELAQLVDERYRDCLVASFQRRNPYQPAAGDPIPLGGFDIRSVLDMRPTAPPWRLANRLDQTRHVRLAGDWATQFRVVFDYSLFEALQGVVTRDTVIATCHPNRDLDEFRLPADPTRPVFPIRAANPRRQLRVIDQLIGAAVRAGASIVVLPELCLTKSQAQTLQQWVRRDDGAHLLIAGSFHHVSGSPRMRRNTAVAWLRGHPDPLTYDKHSPAEHPINEDIQPQGWPELRIYVSADGWHLALAVCRDLLNPQAVHALSEAGANLVLAPAMSERLTPFTGQIAHLVGSGQALVAVANNPADWFHARRHEVHHPARALFGHPGLGQQIRLVASRDSGPGIATMHVRSASIRWAEGEDAVAAAREPLPEPLSSNALPHWVESLAATLDRRYGAFAQHHPDQVALRPAAILVLLTDGPTGLRVALTERASDLADYPGLLTFPGGGQDRADTGPVSTAIREAAEETGLDPTSVHVLGVLPSMADPESKFLVTPVVAWSSQPRYTSPVNIAEVTCVRHVLLSEIGAGQEDGDVPVVSCRPGDGDDAQPQVGILTATVINAVSALIKRHQSEGGHGAPGG